MVRVNSSSATDGLSMSSWERREIGSLNTAYLMALYGIYFFILAFTYVAFVGELWKYQGFRVDLSIGKSVVSVFSLFLTIKILTPKTRAANFFFQLGIVFVLAPSLVIFSSADLSWMYFFATALGFVVVWLVFKVVRVRLIRLPHVSQKNIIRFCLMVSLVTMGAIVGISGFRYVNFDIDQVYMFRSDARSSLPVFVTYLIQITSKVAIPFMIIISVWNRWWLYFAASLLASILIFALTSAKFALFLPFLALGVDYVMRRERSDVWFAAAACVVALISLLSFFWSEDGAPFIGTMVSYRALIIPSWLNWNYIDYFSSVDSFYFWAESKISLGLVRNVHSLGMINLIGSEYWGSEDVTANTGWIGSGYGNGGFFGLVLYSVILGLLFSYLRECGKRHGDRLTTGLFLVPVFVAFTSSDLPPLFLTQGLFFSLLMITVMRPCLTARNSR